MSTTFMANSEEIRSLISKALDGQQSTGFEIAYPSARARSDPALVPVMPPWVLRFGLLIEETNVWIWCEPQADATESFPSQIVIGLPAGRYLIDVLDALTSVCISRESAVAKPLVAGLPFTGSPIVLWIRRIGRVGALRISLFLG
jgi:hypothetical protein